ncbi:MAG TPA: HAD family hydrolase [Albitalea sp.]|uniref:D-glycero-alpha-D-manno-heptose-1,7-bisphosphate 7-phosphatase n=1 Tax=Piscinibacter sp. TaxID=1903157 RepID=UPI002ED2709D
MGSAIFTGQDGPPRPLVRAVFVDKDGTLVENLPYNVDPERVRFTPHAIEGLRLLDAHGFKLVIVTNQPGLAYGMFTRAALTRLQGALAATLRREGVSLAGFYACPHAPGAGRVPGCLCRKPAPGLLRQAARALGIDLARSWMVGDILDDVEAGRRAGCRTVMLDMGNETVWRLSPLRTPHLRAAHLLEAAKAIVAAAGSEVPAAMPREVQIGSAG